MLRNIHANAAELKRAFKDHAAGNLTGFIVAWELYSRLKRMVNRFEDVANETDQA